MNASRNIARIASLLVVIASGNACACLTTSAISEYVAYMHSVFGERSTTTPATVTTWMNSQLRNYEVTSSSEKERQLAELRGRILPLLRTYDPRRDWVVREAELQMQLLECHLGLKRGDAVGAAKTDPAPASRAASEEGASKLSESASQSAREFQARKSAESAGKPKKHDPAAEAHHCVGLATSDSLFGGFMNRCAFKINVAWCTYNPKKDSWAEWHDCRKPGGQLNTVGANGRSAAHTRNAERVYWFACTAPASPSDTEYVPGQGIRGRCR